MECETCHSAPSFTDRELHDVGTGNPQKERNSHGRGTSFDTPSLRVLWLTAPYLHDGSAETLADVFSAGTVHDIAGDLDTGDLEALIDYLFGL